MLPLPDEKSGPGPLVLVTSWLTESSLVQVTVVPFLTLSDLGLNWMFFCETEAVVPLVLFCFFGLAVSLPPPLEDELLLSLLPHPAATGASARTEQSTARVFVMRRTLAGGDEELQEGLLGVQPVLGLV